MELSQLTLKDKQDIVNFYSKHSLQETLTSFNICYEEFNLIFEDIKKYGKVPKPRTRSKEFKEEVVEYCRSHSCFEARKHFHTAIEAIYKILEEYNIPRRSHSEELKICKINYYGSIENYNKHALEVYKKTSLDKYGVDNYAKSEEFVIRSKNSYIDRYGVDNPMKSDEVKNHLSENVMNKYGVPWFCMHSRARGTSQSKVNDKFFELLTDNFGTEYTIQREFVLADKSYDFKVDKYLIEINPTPTHNSTWGPWNLEGIPKDYHYIKSKLAHDNNYQCICVWDWDNVDKILELISKRDKVFARNCVVKELTVDEARIFLDSHHLQGYVKDSIRLGLFYKENLVSVMTFGKPRYNKKYQFELLRYCSICDVIGGAEKLFKFFIRNYSPYSIISYCDLSKFKGDLYTRLGFVNTGCSIGKHWFNMKTGRHITDNLLRQRGFDQLLGKEYGTFGKGTSNEQLMLEHEFVEIYDSGQATFVWKNS